MKANKQKVLSGKITNLSHDGRGITHLDGKTIFVEGALLGEVVEFEYIKRKSRFDEAKLLKVLEPSLERQLPNCSFFGTCGGCSLQHMSNFAQMAHKENTLMEHLQHIGSIQPKEILSPVMGSAWGYRRKARLGVKYVYKKERLLVGFREKNGRYLADIDSCPILDVRVGQKISLLRDFLSTLEAYLVIAQLEVAMGDEICAIIIRHLSPLSAEDLNQIKTFAATHDLHIYLQSGGIETVELLYPSVYQQLYYRLPAYQLELLFSPTDFIQVNAEINQKLIQVALELLQPSKQEVFLDLFCGIGNFTLPIARHSQSVLGLEGCQTMVERASKNASHNHINNAHFSCQDLASENASEDWSQFHGILLDPPRTGAWEIMPSLARSKVARIVYISCNPATLARDAAYLNEHGYSLAKAGVLDMFPHTSHVESIALFKKA